MMFKCDKCDKSFNTYRALNGHKRMHGSSNGKLDLRKKARDNYCDYCDSPVNRKRSKDGKENRFCSLKCFHDYRWKYITKPKILDGYGGVQQIKKYLIETYSEQCSDCRIGPLWNNKPIILQLDHIDGNSDNNNVENVRLLCPNCHSQTETYGAKGFGSKRKKDTKRNRYLREYKSY